MSMTTAPPRPEEPTVPKRRNTELLLSMFAVAIAMFAYANIGFADNGKLPAGMWGYGTGLAAIVAAAHLVIRRSAPYADPLFLPLATMLNGVGLVLIHRLDLYDQSVARALHKTVPAGSTTNQLMYTALGIIAFTGFLLFIKDHKILQRYAYISMVAGLFLVGIPAVLPSSISGANGAKSWVRFPGGISVQPAEFGKLLLVSFFAAFFMQKRDALRVASRKILGMHIPRGRDFGPIVVCWVLAMLILFFETDLGVSLMFFGAFVVLLYIATERTSWLVVGVLSFIVGAAAIATMTTHVQSRVTAWLHPFDVEVTNKGSDQIAQSIYGIANGGIFGKGLDQGRPYLVGFAKNADFILVTVGEELGMVGLFALMMVYLLIVMRGFKTALLIRDNYGKLLASGLAVVFALQVFITAGGVMRVIPLTGLPMPFLAAGGSALVANWVLIAALIRLSDAARRPPPPAIPLTEDELRAMRLSVAVRQPAPAPVPPGASAPTQRTPSSATPVEVPVEVPAEAPAEPDPESQPEPRPEFQAQPEQPAYEASAWAETAAVQWQRPEHDDTASPSAETEVVPSRRPRYGEATMITANEQTEVAPRASHQAETGGTGADSPEPIEQAVSPADRQPDRQPERPANRQAERRYGQ